MARQVVRLDLTKDSPPMLSSRVGQTAYIAGLGGSTVAALKTPQVSFVENCLPTQHGWESIGYTSVLNSALAGFDEIYKVSDASGGIGLVSPAGGRFYQWRLGEAAWTPKFAAGAFGAGNLNSTLANTGTQSYLMAMAGVPVAASVPVLDPAILARLNAAQAALNVVNAKIAQANSVNTIAAAHQAAYTVIAPYLAFGTNNATTLNSLITTYNTALTTHAAQLLALLGTPTNLGGTASLQGTFNGLGGVAAVGSIVLSAPFATIRAVVPTNAAEVAAVAAAQLAYNNAVAGLTAAATSSAGIYRVSLNPVVPWKQLWFYRNNAQVQFTARSAAAPLYVAVTGAAGQNVVTIAAGSFITDGWFAGDFVAISGNGVHEILAVAATTVTLAANLTVAATNATNYSIYGSQVAATGTTNFLTMGIRVGMKVAASPLVTDVGWVPTPAFVVAAVSATRLVVGNAYSPTITGTAQINFTDPDGISGLTDVSGTYTPSGIIGILASGNYLLAYSSSTIYWSSTLNQLDFTPSLTTGAGSASPTDLQGAILACYPVTNGFLIVSTEGILSAQYSGNTTFPWIFKAVAGGMPVIGLEAISHDAIDSSQVGVTAAGLCSIDANTSTIQETEITDFLKQSQYEVWDAAQQLPVTLTHTGSKSLKVTRVSPRFVCISHGAVSSPQVYTQAFIYDTLLKRMGKLAILHVELFTYPYAFSAKSAQIAVCAPNGSISVVDPLAVFQQGVMQFGRIALTRNSLCTLQGLEVEGASQVVVTPLVDGSTPSAPTLMYKASPTTFNSRVTAKGHNITFLAPFDVTYAEVTLHQASNR